MDTEYIGVPACRVVRLARLAAGAVSMGREPGQSGGSAVAVRGVRRDTVGGQR